MRHEIKKSKLNTYMLINERSEFVFKRIVFIEITSARGLFSHCATTSFPGSLILSPAVR